MEIREFFVIAFDETQPLGEQAQGPKEHLSFLGYIRESRTVSHRLTVSEHVEGLALKRLSLPGKKLKRMGRSMATLLDDPTGELAAAKDELFAALMEDGYICTRPSFYGESYKPHVSIGAGQKLRKLESFDFSNLSVTESRFDLDYELLGAEVLSTRIF